ncbi:MAG: hypothetical protein WC091_02710 [Sulfuricellaceae bacterium]
MSKFLKKALGIALPLAASFIPGIGPFAGAALGAGGGLLSGGGLKGALLGGLSGGLGGGWGNSIAGAAGLSGTSANVLSRALSGAAGGAATGGLKGALLGGALGGAGGAFQSNGGFAGLGDLFGNSSGGMDLGAGIGGALKNAGGGLAGPLGMGIGGTLSNVGGGGGSSAYSTAAPVASGAINAFSGNSAADALEDQQKRALGLITPIMREQFDPGNLQNTPGYQFNLDQGTKALNNAASARGNYFSGQALTDATQFASGLADQTYNNAYQQWLADRQQRLGAAGAAAGIHQGIGETRATNILNQGQNASQSLSALLGQLGGGNQQYNPQNGTFSNPNQQGMGIEQLLMMLRQGGMQ